MVSGQTIQTLSRFRVIHRFSVDNFRKSYKDQRLADPIDSGQFSFWTILLDVGGAFEGSPPLVVVKNVEVVMKKVRVRPRSAAPGDYWLGFADAVRGSTPEIALGPYNDGYAHGERIPDQGRRALRHWGFR